MVAIEDEFEDAVTCTFTMDPGTTGNFEITLVETGDMIHSKKEGGLGKCESDEEREALFTKLTEYIES